MAVFHERGNDRANNSKMLRFQPDTFLRVTEKLAFLLDPAIRNGLYSIKSSVAF